jgi:hypothetical protein
MKTRLFLLAGLLLALSTACKSPGADVPCRCGTQMGDLEGCASAACMSGKGDCTNPDCVCGKIEIPTEKAKKE